MKRLCVFCGSSFGDAPAYREAAQAIGGLLVSRVGSALATAGQRSG